MWIILICTKIIATKRTRKYVQIHNWSESKISDKIKYVLYKPLRWRPTFIDKILFKGDINRMQNGIISKIEKYIKNKMKQLNVFKNTTIIQSFKRFKKKFKYNLNNYYRKIIKNPIRNTNISNKQIKLLNNFKNIFKNILILLADKNRGNVW